MARCMLCGLPVQTSVQTVYAVGESLNFAVGLGIARSMLCIVAKQQMVWTPKMASQEGLHLLTNLLHWQY
uniref:Putative secreted protein n=1 Tax=Anopheles marajoara TaxID=58244 RepID=A0A2M4CFL5_9DIPT